MLIEEGLGGGKNMAALFLAVGTVNYVYKMCAAVALIPLLYIARGAIRSYLGDEEAERLRREAASD